MTRKQQPLNWGVSNKAVKKQRKPHTPVVRRSKAEHDRLSTEFRTDRLASLHAAILMFGSDDVNGNNQFTKGMELQALSLVDLRKLKEYKQYIKEFH